MKYIYIMTVMLLLASCGNEVKVENIVEEEVNDKIIEDKVIEDKIVKKAVISEKVVIIDEINEWLKTLEDKNLNTTEDKVVKVDATFNNTDIDVDMMINYSLNDAWKIKTISVEATNFDLNGFNSEMQKVIVWKTLVEASNIDFTIGWASLTTDAFKKALKN